MTRINHTVEQLTTADTYTAFNGLNTISVTITVPDWHEPFPIQVRMGAANPRTLEMTGLLHVCKTWYLNGPIHVPAGTRIETDELPERWEANTRQSPLGKKEWYAYTNGRTAFC